MNIFKSLSQGNGKISETNITSFFSYLLNSTNELDNSFLLLFFGLIDEELKENKIGDLLNLKQKRFREQVIYFSKNYSVIAEPEYSLKKDDSKQVLDIFLKITSKKDETDIACILIENKINKGASNKIQISKQYEFFIQSDEFQSLPTYSLLLTNDNAAFSIMFNAGLLANPKTVWLKWTNHIEIEKSIEAILRKLILLEQRAEIQPINPNTQFILKSFIDYIVTEFSYRESGQKNFNFNGSEEVETSKAIINNKTYILKRFENKMIRVFGEEDNVLDIEVRPLLKEINRKYNLGIDLNHSTGTEKNTQVFGREIISELNKKTV
jgi:hypothetical protein